MACSRGKPFTQKGRVWLLNLGVASLSPDYLPRIIILVNTGYSGTTRIASRVFRIMLIFFLLCYSSNAPFFFYYATVM